MPCDVNDGAALDALVERTVKELGGVDVLVNNAGGTPPTPLLQLSDAAFEAAFHFNVTTALHLTRECVRPMVARGSGVEDIAAAALYLASPAGGWVTGKIFEVDGGTSASNWPIKIPSGL